MKVFQERLRLLRENAGLNQEEIAKLLNITTSAYGYYERGRNEPSLETLKQMASIFKVSADYLLGTINDYHHTTVFQTPDDLTLTEKELQLIKELKKDESFVNELAANPSEHIQKLKRLWRFIQEEY
ncbi:transcriptional regulator with XRE-family HTH domain [Pullulanibacillus pueri]|uniref:Transcriptional regulator n=1 Tax=Pullulanibacillus pueri TaxID=1437324 RepID=A0A8J2ZZ18_9BACL|nr:helix-turn-helix transcriptional regulator [Pullulanibacillus pueri]MBM7683529.1 transcriptional regulator with XRE-family HTH domain [Pullulanibacillus pueri]GGH86904.1 transcriptional regulator [Pullulanibacillus pueri]